MTDASGLSTSQLILELESRLSYDLLCKFTSEQLEDYKAKFEYFKKTNSNKTYSTAEKGKALESLVTSLLSSSGGLFNVIENLHSSTNEIDQLVSFMLRKTEIKQSEKTAHFLLGLTLSLKKKTSIFHRCFRKRFYKNLIFSKQTGGHPNGWPPVFI